MKIAFKINNVNVHFDDLKITHTKSKIVQMDDYYPFGLTFNEFKRDGGLANKYLYNGVENVSDLGLNLNMTLFRPYDPALGRFTGIDPLADLYSGITPYSFGFDNPILFGDPDGLGPIKNFFTRLFNPKSRFEVRTTNGKKQLVNMGRKHKGKKPRKSSGSPTNSSPTSNEPSYAKNQPASFPTQGVIDLAGMSDPFSMGDFNPTAVEIPKSPTKSIPPSIERFKTGQVVTSSGTFVGISFKDRKKVSRNLYTTAQSLLEDPNLRVVIQIGTNFTWFSAPSSDSPYSGTGLNYGQVIGKRGKAVRDILVNEFNVPIGQISINPEPAYSEGNTKFKLTFK